MDSKTDLNLLFDYFTDIKQQIIQLAAEKGINPMGKTISSLDIATRQTGYDLLANGSIYFTEHGRGPTKPGATAGNPNLVEIIQQWIEEKGLDLNAYAVAKTIHKNGTKLYRNGGNSGVLSIPLNLSALEQVFEQIALYWLTDTSAQIYQTLITLT